jgi:hypothetical protein
MQRAIDYGLAGITGRDHTVASRLSDADAEQALARIKAERESWQARSRRHPARPDAIRTLLATGSTDAIREFLTLVEIGAPVAKRAIEADPEGARLMLSYLEDAR